MSREGLTPVEAAVLVAVARGARTVEEIANLLNLDPRDVQEVVDKLVARGLLAKRKRKILFITRDEIRLTRKGYDALPSAEEKLRRVAEKLREAAQAARAAREDGQPIPPSYALTEEMLLIAPLLVTLGLLPAAILTLLENTETFEGINNEDTGLDNDMDAGEVGDNIGVGGDDADGFDSFDADFDV